MTQAENKNQGKEEISRGKLVPEEGVEPTLTVK